MSDTNGTLTGVAVIDRQGHKIGKVVDVFHDLISGDAEWIAVKTGPLNSHHPFVPVQGTYRSDNGDLVVPFDKTTIAHAPYKDTGVAPTRREAEDLARHYELETIDPSTPPTP
jgi:sporulation protein YlmC with PRC-barrel domain